MFILLANLQIHSTHNVGNNNKAYLNLSNLTQPGQKIQTLQDIFSQSTKQELGLIHPTFHLQELIIYQQM